MAHGPNNSVPIPGETCPYCEARPAVRWVRSSWPRPVALDGSDDFQAMCRECESAYRRVCRLFGGGKGYITMGHAPTMAKRRAMRAA